LRYFLVGGDRLDSPDKLIERLRAGEETTCKTFVRAHAVELYEWLYRLTGCREDAEDLAQEAFAAFWQSIRRKIPSAEARIWLFAIARNVWRRHCRSRGRAPESEHLASERTPSRAQSPHDVLEREEAIQAIETALAELDIKIREVFSLRVWHGFTYMQIAAIQHVSPNLVRWRFFRARRHLRARLKGWLDRSEEQ
jgi:RNA polymerase sigma-70 factor (ECF subfamily)